MNPNYFGIAQILIALLFHVALLTGVVIMRKGGRSGSWWCMVFGALLYGAGYLGMISFAFSPDLGWEAGRKLLVQFYNVFSIASMAGTVLFAAGFILHALESARLVLRAEELERLTQAMTAQIQQQAGPNP